MKHIGMFIAGIGAKLWNRGGFWEAKCYEDLKVTGKLGYNLMTKGLSMAGYELDDCATLISKYN